MTGALVLVAVLLQAPSAPVLTPCAQVDVGPCVKLPPPVEEIIANLAIAWNGVAHFADALTTQDGIAKRILVERNPLLRGLADDPVWMALAKGGIALGQTVIFLRLRKTHPFWTIVVASLSAGFTSWAAGHNRRQTLGRF